MFKTQHQGQPSCAHVYRGMIAHLHQVLDLGQRSAGLWIKGDNGESHLLQLWDPIWRDALIAQRLELVAALAREEEIERAHSAA